MLFGLQTSLAETAIRGLTDPGRLAHWQTYVVPFTALTATILIENAFGLAPRHSSFPVLVTAEPLTGLLLGVFVLRGALRASPSAYAGEAGGLVVMTLGV